VQNPSSAPRGAHPPSAAFLIAQIGSHAAARFAERLSAIRLVPAQAGIMRAIASNAGISQQELSSYLRMLPSRLVPFIDELEERALLQRRDNPKDRRLYALYLTQNGVKLLAEIGRIAGEHDAAICAAISESEHERLGELLRRIADEQGLTPGVHPGFARITARRKPDAHSNTPKEPKSNRKRSARAR
jgi:DNA-binding MarR family transcriptional regulator